MKFWPQTLGMQLIAVTAVAVALSNIAVASWFEFGNQQQTESALIDRVLDRAASTAALLAVIPPNAREDAAKHSEQRCLVVLPAQGKVRRRSDGRPMKRKLAARLHALLPPETAKLPVFVDIRDPEKPTSRNPPHDIRQTIQFTVPVNDEEQVVGKFYRPVSSPWPIEVMVAAFVAIVVASSAAAYFARRVTRPLSDLARAASVVAKGGRAPRLDEKGPQDVRNAAIAFNAMTDEVTRTLASQRQLLDAARVSCRAGSSASRWPDQASRAFLSRMAMRSVV